MLTTLQKQILSTLTANYPNMTCGGEIALDVKTFGDINYTDDQIVREIIYLAESGALIVENVENKIHRMEIRLTAKGRDIFNGGGISSITNTVTVKFDAENIRSLIEEGLLKADMPQESKDGILAKLRALPGKALETVTLELIKKAISNPTEALSTIRTVLGPMGFTF